MGFSWSYCIELNLVRLLKKQCPNYEKRFCFLSNGAIIRNHTIIGAGSVVSGLFDKENVIIKGNPANIVRKGVSIKEDIFG